MKPMKTPGVYIVEKNAFPNSVVQVATAVPAFVGYTERALNGNRSLRMMPWRISSMAEFHDYFGHGPSPLFDLVKREAPATDEPSELSAEGTAKKDPLPDASLTVMGEAGEEAWDFVQAGSAHAPYGAMRLFFQNGGGTCYIVSIGSYEDDIDGDAMLKGIQTLIKETEPTILVCPEATRLSRANAVKVQQAMLMHCGMQMKNRFAVLDIFAGHLDRQDPKGDPVATFRSDVGINNLDFGAAYYPWVKTSIFQAPTYENVSPKSRKALIDLLKRSVNPKARPADQFAVEYAQIDWIADGAIAAADPGNAPTPESVDKTLRAIVPLYNDVLNEITARMNVMPPAAAMAGVYTAVDGQRGVWKAPANVSLNSVTAPCVNISHDDQEDLNVTAQGKSINAIRPFVGEGVLVWGARTLDGNRALEVEADRLRAEQVSRLPPPSHRNDLVTQADQPAGDLAADQSGSAGEKDLHVPSSSQSTEMPKIKQTEPAGVPSFPMSGDRIRHHGEIASDPPEPRCFRTV